MKIGWYTHHIENAPNVALGGSVSPTGLFTGQFAGGAEMSDYEIECEIIRMAIDLSVEVDEKRYPDLFFWNQARP